MRVLLSLSFLFAISLNAFGQVPDYVPTEGLVAWYPLDGNGDDHGLNNLHGVVNGALPTNSRIGNIDEAMFFDGNSNIDLGTSSLLNPDTALTFGAWFRLDAANSQSGLSTILGRNIDEDGNRYCYSFGIETTNGFELRFGLENDSFGAPVLDFNTPVELEVGVWFHYMATFSQASGLMIVYLNGIQVGQLEVGDISVNPLMTSTLIGFYRPNGAHSFSGAIDELGVWNRALISYEVMGVTMEQVPLLGCILESACNYDPSAGYDDGNCQFDDACGVCGGASEEGCIDSYACNYNQEADCDDGSCDYSCCPGPGCCTDGMYWDWDTQGCFISNPTDSDLDGCTDLNDLMNLLSNYGICTVTVDEFTCGDIIEHEGYSYSTVLIGDQCWFSENCHYLPAVSHSATSSETSPYYYVYGYEGTDVVAAKTTTNYETYGVLYNWPAVMEPGICPSGWHIPSDGEFADLIYFLGGEVFLEGGKMKEAGYDHWNPPNTGATNSSGFTGLPGGYSSPDGFGGIGTQGGWWSATDFGPLLGPLTASLAGLYDLHYNNIHFHPLTFNHFYGFSARCVRD